MAAQVTSYRIVLHHKTINYGNLGKCWTLAQLRLYYTDNGAEKACWLVFYDPQKTPEVPTADTSSDDAMIFIPQAQYPWHLDLLRNEHPTYYVNTGGDFWQGSLRTAKEPAGEGE